MIKIELPWIDRNLLPNNADGMPWQSLLDNKRRAKHDGKMAAMSADAGTLNWGANDHTLSIVYNPPRLPGPDSDNVLKAMKHTLDGVADALGINDRSFNPIMITRGESCKSGKVTIIIDEDY